MKIGNVELKNAIALAPMAGVTDLPFRLLCKEQGCGLMYTEMVSAKALLYKNRNTKPLLETRPEEEPVAVQLFGSDPEIMSEMALQLEEGPYAIIDVNMGCPVPKIVNNGEGSALMKDPKLVEQILTALVKAINKPVTVKIRKGFDDDHVNAVEIAKIAEACGVAAVAVHGRTRAQYYSGQADWDIIAQVKDAVKIPVIGNGDVDSPEKAKAAKRDISKYECYLEYHIEQGDKLDHTGIDVGVVSGIVSIIDYKVTAKGMSNHAGTTMMANRKDALVGMAKLIVAAEERARELNDTLVFTVGKIAVSPGQENVIPGQAVANFEMRHMDKAVTDQFYADIQALAKEIPNCEFEFVNTSAKYSTPCDPRLIKLIDDVCTEKGISHIIMPSGAGHDANSMAHEGVPIGMIFVPSVKGISHQGDEYTKPEHIDMGADVLYQTVLKLDETGV